MVDNSNAIEVNNLVKIYENFRAVDQLSFSVKYGEVFGLLGSNGAGKTTTLHILTGLLKPTEGEVRVGGHNVLTNPIEVKKLIGYLPESPALYNRLTGYEFLMMIGRLRGLDPEFLEKKIEKLTETLDLSSHIDVRLSAYSKGMRQKISLTATFIHDPHILFLDEPTSGLDPRYIKLVKDWVRAISARKRTTLLCTHVTSIAESICDRVIILDKGRGVASGTIPDLLEQTGKNNLEDAFIELVGGTLVSEF
ncbi:MAG: ABC transporter ATP-binding protein [Thermoplasmata archaeon]|nr:MAG: ABC transporter ATP-binding protein [Thermoplasmata archaeon]